MIVFFTLVCVAAMLIAIRFLFLGAWMVMPFTILEMMVLGGGFYAFEKATAYRELITLRGEELLVRREARDGDQEWSFQPYWVQVILQQDNKSWYPSRLYIRSHGDQVEVGTCLTDYEREKLSEDLQNLIAQNTRVAPANS
ncbi:MAG TPA: hypothetical protein DDW55_07375 [Gammaproteobacteria bacterium]|nr:hypothetical protein [Gammaproteobacteria bacterium]